MVLKPGREAEAEAIFRKWDLDFAVIGHITDTGQLMVRHKGAVDGDMPVRPLADLGAEVRAPVGPTVPPRIDLGEWCRRPTPMLGTLRRMMGGQHHLLAALDLGAVRPHGDGRHRRPPRRRRRHRCACTGRTKGLAATSDVTPRYVLADP